MFEPTSFGESRATVHAARARRTGVDRADQTTVAFASGFGSVLQQEHTLEVATGIGQGPQNPPRTTVIERILRHQQTRLRANIALLEQRQESLPRPARFQALHEIAVPLTRGAILPAGNTMPARLGQLVAAHAEILRNITTLVACAPEGGEPILTEIGHNHAEMSAVLTALLKTTERAHERQCAPIGATKPIHATERREDKGGASSAAAATGASA